MSGDDAPKYFGRYQVLEELGSGAMGVVYLCVDARLARPVAVKVIKDQAALAPAEREAYLARFRQEAEAAGRLSHPDIVQVYDVGPSYMVMEFVEGRPLSQVIQAAEPLLVGEIAAVVGRVADALDYAHRQGIVHRDVKPANIMRLDDGGVKVMDFGVARLPSSTLTVAGTVVGSVRYMAPEQMMGRTVDGRADVFALGAVAYELLTAQAPFPGKTATDVVTRVVHGRHVPPTQVEPRLPPACDAIFARAFASDPAQRFPRAPDFASELRDVLHPVATLCLRLPAPAGGGAALPTTGTLAPTELAPTAILPASAGDDVPTRLMGPPVGAALLSVDSQPEQARVRIDGHEVGRTPLAAVPLTMGRHQVQLELDGHVPAAVDVETDAAHRLHAVSVSLAPVWDDAHHAEGVPFEPDMVPPRRLTGAPPTSPESNSSASQSEARTAVVEGVVGTDGRLRALRVRESAGAERDRALLDAMARWTYAPAQCDGAAVAVRIRVSHHFAR